MCKLGVAVDQLGCLHEATVRGGAGGAKEELLTASEHGAAVLRVLELMLEARDRKDAKELAVYIVAGLQDCTARRESKAAVHNQKYDMVSFSPLSCLGKYVDKVGIVLRVAQCSWEHRRYFASIK